MTVRTSLTRREILVNFDEVVALVLELPQDFRHTGILYALTDVLIVTFLHAFYIKHFNADSTVVLGYCSSELVNCVLFDIVDSLPGFS